MLSQLKLSLIIVLDNFNSVIINMIFLKKVHIKSLRYKMNKNDVSVK